MSFQDDPEAQVAKITRLEAQLDIQKARYDSKIKELKQKISSLEESLEEKNSELELEKRLSTMMLQDQPTRPAVPRYSSDFALHPEVIKLRHDSEVKDAQIFALRTSLENCQSRLTTIQQGLNEDFGKVVQDLGVVLKPGSDFNKLQSGLSSPVADTAAGPSQSSQSASRSEEFRASTPAGSYHPTRSASEAEKVTNLTGSASTTSPTSSYAQAVKRPAEKLPRLPRGKVPLEQSPLFARPPVTHADLAVQREATDQARSESQRRQIPQKPNRASTHGDSAEGKGRRGRGGKRGRGSPGPDKGETSHESTSQKQSPLTNIQHPGSESTQVTVPGSIEKPGESRDTSITGRDQPREKPEAKSSVTTPAIHDTLAANDKEASSNPDPAPAARRRKKVSDEQRAWYIRLCQEDVTSETDSEDGRKARRPPTPPYQPMYVQRRSQVIRGLGDAAAADVKPAQSPQIQPAIPLRKTNQNPPSGKLGDDKTAPEDSRPHESKPPHTELEPKSDTESITAPGLEKAELSHGTFMNPVGSELHPETSETAQPLTSGGPSQTVSPKPSSVDDSTKSSQTVTLPVEQEVTSYRTLLDTPPPEMASPDPAPVGFQFPYEGRRFQNEVETSQERSSNVRKRMADEGRIGTSASSKRLRST